MLLFSRQLFLFQHLLQLTLVSYVIVVSTGSSRTTSIDGPHKIKILEEPQPFGYRFRYQVEGSAHGGLQGVNTKPTSGNTKSKKTFPNIQVSLVAS